MKRRQKKQESNGWGLNSIPHLAENTRHLLSLSLGSLVGTQLPLSDLESPLVFTNLEKLSDSLLVRSKASNLPDQ